MADKIVTRAEAKAQGLKRYFTGNPCKHGHISERIVSSKGCLPCCRVVNKKHRKNNESYHRDRHIKWRQENPWQSRFVNDNWKALNPDLVRGYKRKWEAKALKNNPNFKLRKYLRKRIVDIIKRRKNAGSFVRDLGCSIEELKSRIEEQFSPAMQWDNWGKVWELDHINPLVSFDLTDRSQFLLACHYTNLQPLAVDIHREKSAKEKIDGKYLCVNRMRPGRVSDLE